MKIVTHDSSFHTDDVFAVATLLLKFPDAQVVRSRDPEEIESADVVVDTGMSYDTAKRRFDHHQLGGAGKRENGIEYASFGLVWKEFGAELAGGEKESEIIDRRIVQPVDAHDNGIAIAEYKFDRVREYTIGDFFYSFLNNDTEEGRGIDNVFLQAVAIAQDLLRREIIKAREWMEGERLIKEAYDKAQDKRIIELPSENVPWREVLGNMPEPLFVIYERRDGKWGLKAVPDLSRPYGHNRKNLPEAWGGKDGEELRSITGVPSAIFAHRALFMAAAGTKEGVYELAKLALNQ